MLGGLLFVLETPGSALWLAIEVRYIKNAAEVFTRRHFHCK
jgi:hypothetical protein